MAKIICGFIAILKLTTSVYAVAPTIEMGDKGFIPDRLQISLGESVTFKNTDQSDHWPASNIHPTHSIYPEFDPKKPIFPGQSWEFKFDKAGSWRFHDHLNPQLTGTIIVEGNSSSPVSRSSGPNLNLELIKAYFLRGYYLIFPDKFKLAIQNLDTYQTAKDEQKLKFWLMIIGGNQYLDKLIADTGDGSKADCHQEAHLVGRTAYELFKSSMFSSINYGCHSGYLHGAIEQFVKENGSNQLMEKLERLCKSFPTDFSKFECLHGIGHGLTAYLDYDLPQTLSLCQKLSTDFKRRSCFGGVFMENIMVAQGRGALVGHQTNWVSDDPFFPCDKVDQAELVQFECFQMQTSRMLQLFDYNFARISQQCQKAPANMINVCFRSMGRDIAGQTLRDADGIIGLCQLSPPNFFQDCLTGGLNVIVDFWGESLTDQAVKLCNKLVSPSDRAYCFQLLGQRLKDVFGSKKSKIDSICQLADPLYYKNCLSGLKEI